MIGCETKGIRYYKQTTNCTYQKAFSINIILFHDFEMLKMPFHN